VLSIPDSIIEHKISRAAIHSRRRRADTIAPEPFLFTVNRKELGTYQRSLLEGTGVDVSINSQVTEIENGKVILKGGKEIGFKYLVGAEGYGSVVRRHLGLETKKRLIGFQYTIPVTNVEPLLEIFLEAKRFREWYAWIFPHHESIAVGCCCDPRRADHLKMKDKLKEWMKERGLNPGESRLESFPISYDFQGVAFGNIYLTGEAAGLASGFTGEGIYQSLASGQEVARMIIDPAYKPLLLKEVIRYNRILERVMNVFYYAGPFKGMLQEFLVFLMTRKLFRDRINGGFS
jgi:flavin-dependent dehydrogenase